MESEDGGQVPTGEGDESPVEKGISNRGKRRIWTEQSETETDPRKEEMES